MPASLAYTLLFGFTLAAQVLLAWQRVEERWLATAPQPPARVDLARVFGDPSPITVTVTGAAGSGEWRTTIEEVRESPSLWRRMHVADWSGVPAPLRHDALDRMMLTCGDDIGLGQASPYARAQLCRLHARGRVDVCLAEADYLNPWAATRFVALWMTLLLDEAGGDLELAIRAYNRGIAAAGDRLGAEYGAAVERRLTRFIRNEDAPAAWDYLWHQSRSLVPHAPPTSADGGISAAARPADEIRR